MEKVEQVVYHPTVKREDTLTLTSAMGGLIADVINSDCVTMEDSTEAGIRIITIKTWGVGA